MAFVSTEDTVWCCRHRRKQMHARPAAMLVVAVLSPRRITTLVHAAAVSGVQASLESACLTASYAIGIAVPSAEDFVWLMAGSCCVVAAAASLYTRYFLRVGQRQAESRPQQDCRLRHQTACHRLFSKHIVSCGAGFGPPALPARPPCCL